MTIASAEVLDVVSWPIGFRGLTLNQHRNSDGSLNDAITEYIRVNRFDFSRLQVKDQREPLHLVPGGDLGDATDAFRYLSLSGMVEASNEAKLQDLVGWLFQTFDVEEAQLASPATEGISPLTFTCPTEIVGYTPYQAEQFLARPAGYPAVYEERSSGFSKAFAVELVCADPRRYRQTLTTVTLNSGNGFSQSCPNWDTNVGRYVHPIVTIVTSASGAANFTLTLNSVAFVLDLSGVGAATVVVDMLLQTIKIGATHRADLRTSAVNTFLSIPKGGATATATNTASVTSVAIAYRQARS
jgi:hypothetical protein